MLFNGLNHYMYWKKQWNLEEPRPIFNNPVPNFYRRQESPMGILTGRSDLPHP